MRSGVSLITNRNPNLKLHINVRNLDDVDVLKTIKCAKELTIRVCSRKSVMLVMLCPVMFFFKKFKTLKPFT